MVPVVILASMELNTLPPAIVAILARARAWNHKGHNRVVSVRYAGQLIYTTTTALGSSKHAARRVSRTVELLYGEGCSVEVHTLRGVEARRVIRGSGGASYLRCL